MRKRKVIDEQKDFVYGAPKNDLDRFVGHRLRAQRIFCRLSQEALATEIGITFQQLQKYEKGTNRIPASRLYTLSQALNVPVSYFFQDHEPNLGAGAYEEEKTFEFYDDDTLVNLIMEYRKIKNVNIRQKLLELARVLSTQFDDGNDKEKN